MLGMCNRFTDKWFLLIYSSEDSSLPSTKVANAVNGGEGRRIKQKLKSEKFEHKQTIEAH